MTTGAPATWCVDCRGTPRRWTPWPVGRPFRETDTASGSSLFYFLAYLAILLFEPFDYQLAPLGVFLCLIWASDLAEYGCEAKSKDLEGHWSYINEYASSIPLESLNGDFRSCCGPCPYYANACHYAREPFSWTSTAFGII